jgi:hypothetical protein
MAVALYLDIHVPQAITDQLRCRGVDVITAIEDGPDAVGDALLLDRVRDLGRVLFSQDIRFKALAEEWQRQGRTFSGFLFGHQLHGIGPYVQDLELIAKASDPPDWVNVVEHLPY